MLTMLRGQGADPDIIKQRSRTCYQQQKKLLEEAKTLIKPDCDL